MSQGFSSLSQAFLRVSACCPSFPASPCDMDCDMDCDRAGGSGGAMMPAISPQLWRDGRGSDGAGERPGACLGNLAV